MSKSNGKGRNDLTELYEARLLAEQGIPPTDESFRERFPKVWGYMTTSDPKEGIRCDPAYLSVSLSAGDWQFRLTSPSLKATFTVMVAAFDEGLPTLERALANREGRWLINTRRAMTVRSVKK